MVANVKMSQKKDMVIWKYSSDLFSLKDYYKYIEEIDNRWEGNWKKIWRLNVPSKIQIFLWKLENEVLPTSSFLRERIRLNVDILCRNCSASNETSSHIFKECRISVKFWREVVHWWSPDGNQMCKLLSGQWTAMKIFSGVIASSSLEFGH